MRRFFACLVMLGALPLAVAAPDKSAPTPEEQATRQRLDESIKKALDYLQRSQKSDGSWAAGPIPNGNPAITSLSVMAFLAAGHVPGEGPYADTVSKGIEWVMKKQGDNGLIATVGHHEMYQHGICTLMLAEVCGMTDERLAKEVRQKVEKAVEVILNAQRKDGKDRGGWHYTRAVRPGVGAQADMSITGWQLMALRAAKNVGCDVPAECIGEALEYVKRCHDDKTGGFRYFPGAGVTVACTGTSVLGMVLCGKESAESPEVKHAGAFLMHKDRLPKWGGQHFSYSLYYCSQACFQMGSVYWDAFRPAMHRVLFDNQETDGSWQSKDADSNTYGKNYCTPMAVLALAVEYRYLPIYQANEKKAEK